MPARLLGAFDPFDLRKAIPFSASAASGATRCPVRPRHHLRPPARRGQNPRKVEQQSRERALEIGLEDTFPASDPVAVTEPGPATAPPNGEAQR